MSSDAAHALLLQAVALHQQGRLTEAQALYRDVLVLVPAHADALHLAGVAAAQSGQPGEAVALIDRALAANPANPGAYYNRGLALMALGRHQDAIESYERAIRLQPHYPEAHNNRGNALRDLKQFAEALYSYDEAVRLAPAYAEAHNNRGNVLKDLNEPAAAAESYKRALALRPDYTEAHNSLGTALQTLGRHEEARAAFEQALRLKPDHAEALNNLGVTLIALKLYEAALAAFDQALRLRPGLAAVHYNRAGCLEKLKRDTEALNAYDAAYQLNPDLDGLRGERLHAKMRSGVWTAIDKDITDLLESLRASKRAALPLHLHAVSDDPALLHRVAAIWTDTKFPGEGAAAIPRHLRGGKIRIGYFSPDFHTHALSILMAGLFEAHDRTRFETYAFAYGGAADDAMRARLKPAFDRFIDVVDLTDGDVATLTRGMGIDIAVDLAGYTAGGRTRIFAKRAAPLQVNYLGYPGTMAAPYIDYIVADATVITDADFQYYDEKVALLPATFQPNDRLRPRPENTFTRAALGLPAKSFVFCSFNNSNKITPRVFDGWMRILRAVDGSVLWLFEDTSLVAANLRREAEARGVAGERLVFAKRAALSDHLARHAAADLFLDTLPYNAGTTASDALWMGLPVLTRAGRSYVSRMGASLLKAAGLPELIADTQEAYEALAIALAGDPARLAGLKARLFQNRLSAPLFDTLRMTRHLEDAYIQMMARHDAGLAPDHITVAPRP